MHGEVNSCSLFRRCFPHVRSPFFSWTFSFPSPPFTWLVYCLFGVNCVFCPQRAMCDLCVIVERYTDNVQLSFFAEQGLLCNPVAQFVQTPRDIATSPDLSTKDTKHYFATSNNIKQHRTTSNTIKHQRSNTIKHDQTTSLSNFWRREELQKENSNYNRYW